VAGDGGQAVVYLTHPVTGRVKVGDVEDAGGAVGAVTIHLFSPWEPTFLD